MPHMNPWPRISTIDGVARLQREQLRVEPVADRRDAIEQVRLFDLVENGQAEAAGDGVAAEGRAVMAGLDHAFDRRAGEDGAERQAAAERLGQRDDVGDDAALLEGEERSGAPEAALDLVEDQDRAGAVGDAARGGEEFVR